MSNVQSFEEYKVWQGDWFEKYTPKQQYLFYLIYKFEKENGEPLITTSSSLYNTRWLKQKLESLSEERHISNFDEFMQVISDVERGL